MDPNSTTGNPTPSPVVTPTLATVAQLASTNGGPYYMGRFQNDPNGPVFAWPGSSIFARFTGTGVSVTLNELGQAASYSTAVGSVNEGDEYDVVVDGNAPVLLVPQQGLGTYLLAAGLLNGSHSIVLRKRTEALVGTAEFIGFTVQGQPLSPPATLAIDRRIEIIGDSISAGYGVDGADATCAFSPATENALQSYGYVAAQTLQAEVHINAWSGKGVYRNDDGTTTETMPALYPLTLPGRAANANNMWDFNAWTPQVVVVNLGTNDFAKGIPYGPSFEGAYGSLLGQIRENYPDALIFCALGPMLSDTYPQGENQLSVARQYIQSVVQSSMDPNVFYIEFPTQGSAEGCDSHPNVSTQAAMGAQLAVAIMHKTGWTAP